LRSLVFGRHLNRNWLVSDADSLGTTIDPEQVAAMLLAIEDGFRLHRLIDPDGTPPDSFVRSLSMLQRALSGGDPGDADDPGGR